jgi:hemolysin activation/secretion protein
MNGSARIMFRVVLCVVLCCFAWGTMAKSVAAASEPAEAEKIKERKEAAEKAKREAKKERAKAALDEMVEAINLPEDIGPRMTVRELRISGNRLISTDELLKRMPAVYNASAKPLREAESEYLFDLRVLQDIAAEPGEPREVSIRTIEGLTQYILSVYMDRNYAGILVYVPKDAVMEDRKLRDDILPIEIIEAAVTAVSVKYYDPNQNEKDKGYLRRSAMEEWSPIEMGQVANQKELDDFVNLLNLNPDRYVSAVVTKGITPDSLAVRYDVYEANPWHYFIQVDNSGTRERRWSPRIGLINTNLLGFDDTFTAIYQAPWDSGIDENYSLYGSYDFPVMGPRLRLNLYAGHSEFDINPESGPFDFIGRGTFYGGKLRYNVLQTGGWFFDITGGVEYTRSRVNPSLFTSFLGTDIKFWLWGWGLALHRRDDMSSTSLSFDRYESWGGESDASEFGLARTNSSSDFSIYTGSASHSRYLDDDKVNRLSGTFRWVGSNERLVPAKMTAFGGMYSVRGYDEYEVIADGGILASAQYEFDLVKHEESKERDEAETKEPPAEKPLFKRIAPLVFFDYGRAKTRHAMAGLGEKRHEELMSVGPGIIVELGDDFSAGVYYGFPLRPTDATRTGKGRFNFTFTKRF